MGLSDIPASFRPVRIAGMVLTEVVMSIVTGEVVEGIQHVMTLLIEKIREVESPDSLRNLWLAPAELKAEVNDETFHGDLFMEGFIIGLFEDKFGKDVVIYGEEGWNISPEDKLPEGHYFILDPLDGSKGLHKIAKGEKVFQGYGVLIAEIKDGEVISSMSVGRFGDQYLGFFASESGIQILGETPDFFVQPPHTIVIGNSKKNGATRLDNFAFKSKELLRENPNYLSENLCSVWANVVGIILGMHGAYVCTHNAMVYDYSGLAHLFQKMGGLVIDLGAEDGLFQPRYGQQALMFLHPTLPRAKKIDFLSLYLGEEKATYLLD